MTAPQTPPTLATTNRHGKIAVIYQEKTGQPKRAPHLSTRSGTTYNFEYRNGVSIAWVDAQHLGMILQERVGCCNNKYLGFRRATLNEVTIWEQGR